MDLSLIPIWLTSTASAVGVVYAIVRNGSRGRQQDEKLKTEMKHELANIQRTLSDPETGLRAIKRATEEQRLYCAKVSTELVTQVQTHAEEINKLRDAR